MHKNAAKAVNVIEEVTTMYENMKDKMKPVMDMAEINKKTTDENSVRSA
jgi:hypothetical protein